MDDGLRGSDSLHGTAELHLSHRMTAPELLDTARDGRTGHTFARRESQ